MAEILKAAIQHPIDSSELRSIIEAHAFGESVLNVEPALMEGRWQLLREDGTTPIKKPPELPLTLLQKRWLKAISLDPRLRLFVDEAIDYPDVEPLFTQDHYAVFDKYADGDDYESEAYRANFRLILNALHHKEPLRIEMESHRGKRVGMILMPQYLEYSEKDDNFRLIGRSRRFHGTVNLGRITKCEKTDDLHHRQREEGTLSKAKSSVYPDPAGLPDESRSQRKEVVFELVDRRNALERVLLHFAHFKKQTEKVGENRYKVTISYDRDDETEIVIRLLSFGPMIRVTGPEGFVELIKERLKDQKSCGLK